MAIETISNINDANQKKRLAFVSSIFEDVLKLVPQSISPIAYEENFPFPYNNFVYGIQVDVHTARSDSRLDQQQPGTCAIPSDTSSFVIRLPNPASGYNDKVRVENEVAALSLAREALGPTLQHLVPRVFRWASAADAQGWILQEYMPGRPVQQDFDDLSDDGKANLLGQMADVLACFQRYKLPHSIRDYGGVCFDTAGRYCSAPLSIMDDGPFSTYEAFVRGTIQSKLRQADEDPQVDGWRQNQLRGRLDRFLTSGLHQAVKDSVGKLDKVLIHADLSIDNILYDKATMRLTAVLDFDFAHVATVADEFFRSLGHGIGRFPYARESEEDLRALHVAMLEGFPTVLPPRSEAVDWTSAKAWEDALRERDLERPSTIPNIVQLADLFRLSSEILPFKLCNPVVVSNSSHEQLRKRKKEGETRLFQFLGERGY